jgi:predicted component of type VI protein secretion system
MALSVWIAKGPDTQERVVSFDSSPVRIGRNRLNDIVFDQLYVSQWHAVIRFQGNDITVMDLGSTNGTKVNGQRLRRETPMVLTSPNDVVQIGNIALSFGFSAPAGDAYSPQYAPMSEATVFDVFDPAVWLSNLRGTGERMGRDDLMVAFAMERVGLLVETFVRSYVELRDGTAQFEREMGLHLATESTPLHDLKTHADAMAYLLDWTAGSGERIDEVKRAFAGLAVHQVAVLNGVMAGVRELLEGLAPKSGGWGRLVSGSDMEKKRRELLDEDRFARIVFGKAFERAYYAMTGGKIDDDGHGGLPPGRSGPPSHSGQ